ncbi:hypothetical protein CGT85_06030 [Vibrio cholerae]|nr:hypothetical protein CGT85_06030 [Vibrio cholerae]
MQADSYYREIPLSPSYLKLQRCWLRSLTPITVFIYAHGDYESHPWLSPKTSRWLCKFVPDKFVTLLSPTCNSK